ncbi:kinase-like domain-containing protein [Xylaria sp. FL1042]|nr:kinase-like domain-containing protein [Xylaria sp. FL1042]
MIPDTYQLSDNILAGPVNPGTESYVVDYGFLARARLQGGPTASSTPQATPRATNQRSLKYSLKLSMVSAAKDDKQTFLPLGQLDTVCNRNAVEDELRRTFTNDSIDITQYVNYICGDPSDDHREEHTSRKIFAILVLIDQLQMITTFSKEGIKDKHLPFRKVTTGEELNDFVLIRRSTLDQSSPQTLHFFNNWNSVDKREFYQTQWQLLSPFFGKPPKDSAPLYKLDEQTIMPWVSMGKEQTGAYVPLENIGGYSTVRKIVIHQDHHSFETDAFAIKELFDGDEGPFTNEFDNLKRVQTRKHLLPVYAAYFCGNKYSFIFPWANGGSLDGLWKKEPQSLMLEPEKDFHTLIKWVAGQLSGLTGEFGLGFLHGVKHSEALGVPGAKPFGIHGDIKPSNILYFKQDSSHDYFDSTKDHLKISDFGLTGFHSAKTRSHLPATGPHSPTYRSPEWGKSRVDECFLSRKYDIWSLGCVFLEFIMWLINGPEALRQFNEDRKNDKCDTGTKFREDKFFVVDGKEQFIKDSVTQWTKSLQDKVGEGNYIYDCLTFITERMLGPAGNKRADCSEVHKFLEERHQWCLQNDQYSKIKVSTGNDSITRGPFKSNYEHISNESIQAVDPNSKLLPSVPAEQRLLNPQITVTDTHGENVDQINPGIDYGNHVSTLSPDGRNSHGNSAFPIDYFPQDQRSSQGQALSSSSISSVQDRPLPPRRPSPPEENPPKRVKRG